MSIPQCTTYCIYIIACFQNATIYVGQTLDPRKRKRVHFQQLRDGIHVNIHLQSAFNKYGQQAFYFEVIERDVLQNDIDEREQYWINHYDSFRNGFNRTPGGNRVGGSYTPIVWNGIWYESVSECERVLGVSMKWRIAQGYTSDEELKPPGKRVKCEWNGIAYSSQAECARVLGIDPSTIRDFLARGYTCDADVSVTIKPCVWNGISYKSQSDAARACGISTSVMAWRIKKGYTCDDDVQKRGMSNARPFVYEGVEYESKAEYSRITGVGLTTLHYRLKHRKS